jgi:hypothetical protein
MPEMREGEFLIWVLSKVAMHKTLLVFHDFDSALNAPGLPDLIIVGGKRVLWRELKVRNGKLNPAQTQ